MQQKYQEYSVAKASDWLRGGPTRQSCRAVSPNGQAAATDQLRPRQRRRADARRLNPKVHIFPRRLLDDWRQAADNGAVSQARVSSERSVSGGTYGAAFSSNLSSRQTHRRRPLSLPWLATASRPAWDFFSAPLVTAAPFTLGALTLRYVLWRKGRRERGGVCRKPPECLSGGLWRRSNLCFFALIPNRLPVFLHFTRADQPATLSINGGSTRASALR